MAKTPVGPSSPNLGLAMRRLNELEQTGLIKKWAIGGAFAFMHYSEPVLSYDIDVFTSIPSRGILVSMEPVYDHLRSLGYEPEGDAVLIERVPIQFLDVAPDSLEEDAVCNAVTIELDGEPARVFSVEHAVAISLKTNRRKDRERIGHLLETATTPIDEAALNSLLERFSTPESDLPERWLNLRESDG
jgi:hypothetical protein